MIGDVNILIIMLFIAYFYTHITKLAHSKIIKTRMINNQVRRCHDQYDLDEIDLMEKAWHKNYYISTLIVGIIFGGVAYFNYNMSILMFALYGLLLGITYWTGDILLNIFMKDYKWKWNTVGDEFFDGVPIITRCVFYIANIVLIILSYTYEWYK